MNPVDRRKALKALAVGTPIVWSKPIVDAGRVRWMWGPFMDLIARFSG